MAEMHFTPFPALETNRLMLRQVAEADAAEIYFLRSDPGVMAYIDRPPAQSIDEAYRFIRMILGLESAGEGITWAITLKGDPRLVGTICYWNIKMENYRAEIGYVLHPEQQGRGIMQEAAAAVLGYGFGAMGLHSVEAHVNPHNLASIRVLERNGFIQEGFFRESYYYDGRFRDMAVYSLLAPASH